MRAKNEYAINEVKTILLSKNVPLNILELFAQDDRESVKKMLLQYYRRLLVTEQEKIRLYAMYNYERSFQTRGLLPIAGTDEAGRGPLAGPVVAAAVILPMDCEISGLNDSKKISAAKREQLFTAINDRAIAVSYSVVASDVIDEINIYQASRLAMYQALNSLVVQPKAIISDAMPLPDIHYAEVLAIEKADSKSANVAAASIVAKVIRDRIMCELDTLDPRYGFAAHKGYGTMMHMDAIRTHGVTKYHRRTFAPMPEILAIMDKKRIL
ncbi:MAG: ribonuclease HII [Negativicutes bacterium]|jgi:ribonuclease HII